MREIRVSLAIIIFIVCTYLVYDLFVSGFNWKLLVIAILGYFIAHFFWPKKKVSDKGWFDLVELVVELPFRIFEFLLKSIARLFRGVDGGLDL